LKEIKSKKSSRGENMKNIGTKSQINKEMIANDFRTKKKFGQNFLVDQNILKKIVDASSITDNSLVIEIGPGMGSLTEHIMAKAKHVLAYEIDNDLIPILNKNFNESKFTLINDDFLHRNIDEDIKTLNLTYDKVAIIANLPYYITTPIIFKVLEESDIVSELLIMMQLEVARRITSKPKTKDYNALSVVIQFKTEAAIALKVPRTVFIPAPNVDSAVVKLNVIVDREIEPTNEKEFYGLVKAAFKQRRKTLVNNLHEKYHIKKSEIVEILEDAGYKGDIRAEHLEVSDFVTLSDLFTAYISR